MLPHALTLDDRGSGRPFLLLHGGAGPQSMLPFAELLVSTRPARVLTPTAPGFDGTPPLAQVRDVADLARTWLDLLDAHDLHDVTVVGNSVGGWTAAAMLLDPRAGERISAAVLLDPVGILVPEHPIADLTAVPADRIADYGFHDPDRFRIDPSTLPAAGREMMLGNAAALARYAGDPYMHDPGLRGRLAEVTLPVRLVWGVSDRVVTPGYGSAFADAIPGAELVVLAETGHLPQIEQPARTRDLVWEFAAGPAQAARPA